MRLAIDEMGRRRRIQRAYNEKHGITPTSIVKEIDDVLSSVYERDYVTIPMVKEGQETFRTQAELEAKIATVEADMRAAAANLEFERAATMRDRVRELRRVGLGVTPSVR